MSSLDEGSLNEALQAFALFPFAFPCLASCDFITSFYGPVFLCLSEVLGFFRLSRHIKIRLSVHDL